MNIHAWGVSAMFMYKNNKNGHMHATHEAMMAEASKLYGLDPARLLGWEKYYSVVWKPNKKTVEEK